MTIAPRISPGRLWRMAGGGTSTYDHARYLDLMVEHGWLVRQRARSAWFSKSPGQLAVTSLHKPTPEK